MLAYHAIDDPQAFEAQIGFLASAYRPVALEEVARCVAGGNGLPRNAVLVTFDDGHRSVLELGLPVLRDLGVPSAVFVVTEHLDGSRPFWWQEVESLVNSGGRASRVTGGAEEVIRAMKRMGNQDRLAVIEELRASAARPATPTAQLHKEDLASMESAGMTVGNHTRTHPILPRCSDEEIGSEVDGSHRDLAAALGREPDAFAYPNGDWDERAERRLLDLGYRTGFTFDHRHSGAPPARPLRISRLRVSTTTSPDRFRAILSGLHPAIHGLRVRGRKGAGS